MELEEKLNLKIIAVRQALVKRVEELDDEVANLRVALTETTRELETTQQEFNDYRLRNPEETDVPQAPEDDTQN